MRILLGGLRRLTFLILVGLAQLALGCDQLPAGESLWVRLSSPISTYSAHVGDPVHAVLTQDIVCGNEVVLPMGTPVEGVVKSKHKVGWGIRYETATLELEFTQAKWGLDSTVQMTARVEEVENAREHVKNGVIHGVMSSDTFQGRVNSRLIHMPTWNPYTDLGLIVYKATFPIFPEPEIYYPSGTDMRLVTKVTVAWPSSAKVLAEANPADDSQLDAWLQGVPQRTTTLKSVDADMINLVFLGSRQQVEAAFREAGWKGSDPVSRRAVMRGFYALLNNSGYAQQPMKSFLMEGKPENMNWQKGLNSYGRRDHLRIWEWTPEGATEPVWVSSSTHDTGAILSVKYKGFVHHISPDIDNERAKVIRDLNFEGCVQSVSYMARPGVATMTQNAIGDLVRTDGSVAVVQLRDCQPVVPGLKASPSTAGYKPGNYAFRYIRKEILTFRNDIWRANIIYGAYDLGRMAVAALRHQPLPPIGGDNRPVTALLPSQGVPGSN
ncbi:MAG TPA: LssY C-terminal domain-containing protein [Candidatus Angelobacter sp.]|nr:LssY C-terminal domain-containing protein [Candidatus Angelobacter sp.]